MPNESLMSQATAPSSDPATPTTSSETPQLPIVAPRRPIKDDPDNPLADWISGKRVERHPDGRLWKSRTLDKLAWCWALLGYDEDVIAAAVKERDSQPKYHRYDWRRDGGLPFYSALARWAITSHQRWQVRANAKTAKS